MLAAASGIRDWFSLQVFGSLSKCPRYWSKRRDDWMVDFVRLEGNDLLAGAVATVTAKIVANSWYVEGPLLLCTLARRLLLHNSDFGRGWDSLVSKWVQGYLNRDAGGTIELARASATDFEGPAMGYHHIDESKLTPTGDPVYPFEYYGTGSSGPIKMHHSQLCHIVDMPSGREEDRGVGFCSVSRALVTAHILRDIVRYKRERLSDLLPAGLLLINNIGKTAWEDLLESYDARQHNQGNKVWRDVMVALGVDPAYPLQAEFFEFSQLPEGYDDKAATEMAVYTFALAFREDPREFWPVSSGPLGTATEAELQARSARIKGEGIIATNIERQLNRLEAVGGMSNGRDDVVFHFDYQDDEQDKLAAEIANIRSQTIRRLWEPAKVAGASFDVGGAPQGKQGQRGPQGEEDNTAVRTAEDSEVIEGELVGSERQNEQRGIITTEEARQWLIHERIIPWAVTGQPMEVERLYDTKAWKSSPEYGPRVRLYKDGRCFKWE